MKKIISLLPTGPFRPAEQHKSHLYLKKRSTGSLILVFFVWIIWKAQENIQLCGTAPSMLTGPRHMWIYNKESSRRSFFWAELSMSPLSRRELLILHLDSNFNNTFLYKHYRISVFFQQSCNNKQVIPPFPCQIFFSYFSFLFWAI